MNSFFTYKNIKWLGIAALAALLLPMLFMAFYATPMADDFSFGALKGSGFSFGFPGLVTAFSYCLVSAMFCPPIYAMGNIGEARAWHDCFERRLEVLRDESIKDARVEPYPCQPYLLFYSDIVDDPEGWENVDMASFYGKDSVSFNTIN